MGFILMVKVQHDKTGKLLRWISLDVSEVCIQGNQSAIFLATESREIKIT